MDSTLSLEEIGFDTVVELAPRNPGNLDSNILLGDEEKIGPQSFHTKQVGIWINQENIKR